MCDFFGFFRGEKAFLARLSRLLFLPLLFAASQAFAASGQFTFVTGDVQVIAAGNRTVAATRGMEVNSGDIVVTGDSGMAQLTMVDAARLSVRSNTRLRIESYASQEGGSESSLLNLIRGTLRSFTGFLSTASRDKFQIKTRVATVGIRGSGALTFHCDTGCPSPEPGQAAYPDDTTLNHTIEGGHIVNGLVTGPGDTVLANALGTSLVPTPDFIKSAAFIMTRKAVSSGDTGRESVGRDFANVDDDTATFVRTVHVIGGNGLGFAIPIDFNRLGLRDIVVAGSGAAIASQAIPADITLENGGLRAFSSYAGLQSGINVAITGGTLADVHTVDADGTVITLGRWDNGDLVVQGASGGPNGSVHFAYASSGNPGYLSEVLTGTAAYTLAAATSPANQNGTTGTLGSATLDVNFSNRTLNAALAVSLPAAGGNSGGSWRLNAANVPFALNSFYASTAGHLVIANGAGITSTGNAGLYGSINGSFAGTGLSAAILGYGFTDQTSGSTGNFNTVNGVAAFTGPRQNTSAAYRDGLVSDANGVLANASFIRNFATTNRPSEVTQGGSGAVSAFAAPYVFNNAIAGHAAYSQGSASVAESGIDPATGLTWGRWAGGAASVASGGSTQTIALANNSLHYIFGSEQTAPVSLPLTGSAVYDVIGSTRPTDNAGHTGSLNSATLAANFTNRTVDLGVNFAINGQTWNAAANNVPIYRDQYFSAYAGPAIQGVPSPAQLNISCAPSCGAGASGAVDGFFTGRSGQGAGMMYNVGGNSGAVALARRGG
jgi:hypothetical protein